MNQLYVVQISGTEHDSSSDYPNFEPIPGLTLQVDAVAGDKLLVTLTAPDTWINTVGVQGWFAITANSEIVAQGLYTVAAASQRIPISLQALVNVSTSGTYQLAAEFCCRQGGTISVGSASPTVLTVLRA